MPPFMFELGGRRFEVEAPTLQNASEALKQHLADASRSVRDAASSAIHGAVDAGKSAVSGLASGTASLVGLPGDLTDLATRGIDAAFDTRTNEAFGKAAGDYAGGRALRGYLENAVGPLHEPQTRIGRYAQTIGDLAPLAVGGLPGLAGRLATRALIPGLASETAGQLAEGREDEALWRLGAGVGGAVAAPTIVPKIAGSSPPLNPVSGVLGLSRGGVRAARSGVLHFGHNNRDD
jgi:hypothetical protein